VEIARGPLNLRRRRSDQTETMVSGWVDQGRTCLRAWRLDRRAAPIIDGIDADRFEAIRARHRDADPDPGSSKYLDLRVWVRVAVGRALGMDLHRRGTCDVLDLGTGCGYFPLVCRHFGHRARALDLADNALYNEMIELLRIDRTPCAIVPGVPLPRFETRFDWVTGFMVCFNNHERDDLWGPAEWEFFLEDVREHQLKPGGQLHLELNPERDGRFMTPEVERVFVRAGASVRGGTVRVPARRELT
jgi:SAM-dependent methyltransferase